MPVRHGQHADPAQTLQGVERARIDPVLACGARAEDGLAIAEQHLYVLRRPLLQPVLHKHQRLAAAGLHDQVQVRADHQRRGLPVLLADGDDVGARRVLFERDVDFAGQRFVLRVAVNFHLPGTVRFDQRDVQFLNAARGMNLTEIGFHVQPVGAHRNLLDVTRLELNGGHFAGAERTFGAQLQIFAGHFRDALPGLCCIRAPGQAPERGQGLCLCVQVLFVNHPAAEQCQRGFLCIGILTDQAAPFINGLLIPRLDCGRIPFRIGQCPGLRVVDLAESKEDLSGPAVECVCAQEALEQGACRRVLLVGQGLHALLELGIQNALLAGGPVRAVREAGTVALPGGDGVLIAALREAELPDFIEGLPAPLLLVFCR